MQECSKCATAMHLLAPWRHYKDPTQPYNALSTKIMLHKEIINIPDVNKVLRVKVVPAKLKGKHVFRKCAFTLWVSSNKNDILILYSYIRRKRTTRVISEVGNDKEKFSYSVIGNSTTSTYFSLKVFPLSYYSSNGTFSYVHLV